MVAKRVSNLFCSEEVFDKEANVEDAFENAGLGEPLVFIKPLENPPFNESVKTNVAARFLALIDKSFKGTDFEKYLTDLQ